MCEWGESVTTPVEVVAVGTTESSTDGCPTRGLLSGWACLLSAAGAQYSTTSSTSSNPGAWVEDWCDEDCGN